MVEAVVLLESYSNVVLACCDLSNDREAGEGGAWPGGASGVRYVDAAVVAVALDCLRLVGALGSEEAVPGYVGLVGADAEGRRLGFSGGSAGEARPCRVGSRLWT
jgi:hypothetical protein